MSECNENDKTVKMEKRSHQTQQNNIYGYKRQKKDSNHTTQTSIPYLNDDCLLEIFSTLNVANLCNVADVCPRFEENAKLIFSTKHKKLDFYEFHIKIFGSMDLFEGFNLLRLFGNLTKNLEISPILFQSDDNQTTDLIIKYCTGTLNKLKLDSFTIDNNVIAIKLQPIFANLQKLTLFCCTFYDSEHLKKLLLCCIELKKLKIKFSYFPKDQCLQLLLSKLEIISIEDTYGLCNQSIAKFFEKNQQ